MWRKELDPYIAVHATTTPSVLPIIFQPPGMARSVHITIYLPTSGLESEFIDALAELSNMVDDLEEKFPEALFFIRGDSNVNPNNSDRVPVFELFLLDQLLSSLNLHHSTYHHFTGNGASDSQLDVILSSRPNSEQLLGISCKLDCPLINSSHDLIRTAFNLPNRDCDLTDTSENITAPKVPNDRIKINWSDEGTASYQEVVSPQLAALRSQWNLSSSSTAVLSVLLQSTNKS